MIRVFMMIIFAMPISSTSGRMKAKDVEPELLCVARPGCTFHEGVICISVLAHDLRETIRSSNGSRDNESYGELRE